MWCYFFTEIGNLTKQGNIIVGQARKAMHVLYNRNRNIDILIDLYLYL